MMAVLCIATHAGAANWSKPTFANKGQRSVIVAGCQLTLEQSLLSHQIKQSNKRPYRRHLPCWPLPVRCVRTPALCLQLPLAS